MGGLDLLAQVAEDVGTVTLSAEFSAVACWALAAVFAVSGMHKLRHPALSAAAIVDFGFGLRPERRYGVALGTAESALAVSLALSSAIPIVRLPVAATAACLLWLFTALILRSVRADKRFECFCFGSQGGEISIYTSLRTGGLAVLATVAAMGASSSGSGAEVIVREACAGLGALATWALIAKVPSLVRWNRDPLWLDVETVQR